MTTKGTYMADTEELLTPDELAAWLKVPKSWVYDSVQSRSMPHLRLNRRRLRFKITEVTEWLREQTAAQAAEPVDTEEESSA
jgi:excisionase family DNA binding protein